MRRLAWLVSVALAAGCSKPAGAPDQAPSTQPSLFHVPQAQLGHLKLVDVQKQAVTLPVKVPARVEFDELKTSRVVPLVGGKVARILVHEGDHVKKHQVLLTIASPDASDVAASVARDRSDLQTKQIILKRDQDLYEHKAISLEELQQAQLDVASAKATLGDDLSHAAITGGGSAQAALHSPIDGTVVARNISVGEAVSAGSTACFTITDPSAVWVIAQLYQDDLRLVQVGDSAVIRSPVLQTPISGKVSYVGSSIDPDTLTIPVRIAADNPGGLLKQGMYVDAEIVPAKSVDTILLPAAALLRDDDNLPFVYVQTAPGEFARRHVEVGSQKDDTFTIASGLEPGEKVLADGAVFVQFADGLER